MAKAEKNRLKIFDLKSKYKKILDQFLKKDSSLKEDKKPKDIHEKMSPGDIISMQLDNGNIVP